MGKKERGEGVVTPEERIETLQQACVFVHKMSAWKDSPELFELHYDKAIRLLNAVINEMKEE